MEENSLSKSERREIKRKLKEAKRAQEGRKGTIGKIIWTIALLAIVGGFIVWFMKSVFTPKPGMKNTIQSREHVNVGAVHDPYSTNPPTSGPHYAAWSKCGIFEELLPAETFIHNMEHGAVVVFYKPDLAKEEVQKLKDFVTPLLNEGWIVMVQNKDIPSNIAFASWGWYQLFDAFDEEAMKAYYNAHMKQGPERIPCEYEG